MHKVAIIIFGNPGSGKSTQAELLTKNFNFIHFNTGKFLESIVFDPKRQKEKAIQKERKNFEEGKLMTPSFVIKEIKKELKKIANVNMGLVFSGSPRTLYEAQKIIPFLKKHYHSNIIIIKLKISSNEAIKRNSNRLVCSVCGYTLLSAYFNPKNIKYCPVCGGKMYKRVLDNPKTMQVRLKEYKNRTKPVFDFLKNNGFKIFEVNAKPAPYKIFERIKKIIKNRK